MALERELGKVRKVDLFIEDHGLLTFFVDIDFGGSGQGFGGYTLDTWDPAQKRRVGTAGGLDLILSLLQLFKIERLEAAAGRTVYALREQAYGPIVGLETPAFDGGRKFLISDWQAKWFPK